MMWFIGYKYITCTSSGRLTKDTQNLALALQHGSKAAPATILLGHYYQGIYVAVTIDHFKEVSVDGWMIQLWLLAYFLALRLKTLTWRQGVPSRIVVENCTCTLSRLEVVTYLNSLKEERTPSVFLFNKGNDWDLLHIHLRICLKSTCWTSVWSVKPGIF